MIAGNQCDRGQAVGEARARKGAGWRIVCAVLAVFALALSNAIPSGFMPVQAADGNARLVICTGYGPIDLDPGSGPHNGGKTGDRHAPCPFAGHGAPATPVPADLASVHVTLIAAVLHDALEAGLIPGRGMAAPPPPARGPPHILV